MRLFVSIALASFLSLLVWFNSSARAQETPALDTVPATAPGPLPAGVIAFCTTGPGTGARSPTCPIVRYNGLTIWALDFTDNRMAMLIAAFDANGRIVKQWEKGGARYNWQINIDETKDTVTFMGQSGSVAMTFDELDIFPPQPGQLIFVDVSSPAINCFYTTTNPCTVSGNDSVGDIPVPPGIITGPARLQTRTILGAAGSPAAGKTGYLYRVDMTQAVSSEEVPCVTDLSIDFGPLVQFPYAGSGSSPADVFVINQGGIGDIGLFAVTKKGSVINFTFNQPVCAGPTPGTGRSSRFIGVTSASAPKAITAKVGWPGLDPLGTPARGPAY
jgi:hypothetical protein